MQANPHGAGFRPMVDEAHMARCKDGILNNTFRLLKGDLFQVTGTPLVSSLKDIMFPLRLI